MPTIVLDPTNLNLVEGDSPKTVTAKTTDIPDNETLQWTSSNTDIITVGQSTTTVSEDASSNTVVAVAKGSATVTVSYDDTTTELPVTVTAKPEDNFIITPRTDATVWSASWGASGINMVVFVAITDQDYMPVTGPYTVSVAGAPENSLEHINGPTPLNSNGVAECHVILTGNVGDDIVITPTLNGENVNLAGTPFIIELVKTGSIPPAIPAMVDGVIDDTDVENGVYVNMNLAITDPGQTVVLMIGGAEERYTTPGSNNILPALIDESYLTNGVQLIGYYQVDAVGNATFSSLTPIYINRTNGGGGINDLEQAIIPEAESTGFINKVIADSTPHAIVNAPAGAEIRTARLIITGNRNNDDLIYRKSVIVERNTDQTFIPLELNADIYFYPIGEGYITITPSLEYDDGKYHTADPRKYIVDVVPPGSV